MQDFKNILVWKKAHEFTIQIYQITKNYPKDEQYGITSQLRRASSSICANIVEGANKRTDKDFAHFLQTAFASACECEYFLILSKELDYIDKGLWADLNLKITEIQKMINGFLKTLRN